MQDYGLLISSGIVFGSALITMRLIEWGAWNNISDKSRLIFAILYGCGGMWDFYRAWTLFPTSIVVSALMAGAGICLCVCAWLIYKGGKPPRRKRKRVREALRRIGSRLVAVPAQFVKA